MLYSPLGILYQQNIAAEITKRLVNRLKSLLKKGYHTHEDLLRHVSISTLFILCKYVCQYLRLLKYEILHNPDSILILIPCDRLSVKKNLEVVFMFQAQSEKLRDKQ